jgi:hypothetical protein
VLLEDRPIYMLMVPVYDVAVAVAAVVIVRIDFPNGEIKRSADVVGIFPNENAIVRSRRCALARTER